MERSSTYRCKENDNVIKIIYNDNDGVVDEVWFSDCLQREWTVIGINDLEKALKTARAKIQLRKLGEKR